MPRSGLNSYEIRDGIAYLELANVAGEVVAHAMLDEQDIPALLAYGRRWSLSQVTRNRTQYVRHGSPTIYLHRHLLGEAGLYVDHINGNGLDCRRSNLRVATASQNSHNRQIATNNKSGKKGVRWHKSAKKWVAVIRHEGHSRTLGYFSDLEAAARAYDEAAQRLFGKFAYIGTSLSTPTALRTPGK